MSDAERQTQIAAARAYEEFFVPALFGQWAAPVADAAGVTTGQHVLDIACGTGVLTREVASRVGCGGFVAGVDRTPGMLAVAAERAPTIEWREGDAEALPYPDQRFDAVVSQFGLMLFADPVRALSEMRRVLKPGGHLAVAVWAGLDTAPAYAALVGLLERLAGKPAADALRAPFSLGNPRELAGLAPRAGVVDASIATPSGIARFPSLRFMVEAELRGWLPLMGVVLAEDQIVRILGEAEHVLGKFLTPAGTMEFPLAAHILTATRT